MIFAPYTVRQRIHDVVLESIGSGHLVKQVQERCDCDHFDRLVRDCDHFTMVVVDPLEGEEDFFRNMMGIGWTLIFIDDKQRVYFS